MKRFQLVVVEGTESGRTIPLEGHEIQLGRAASPGATAPGWIFFADPTVSRVHAALTWDHREKAYSLRRRSESNLLELNGKTLIRGTLLKPGDEIALGGITLKFHEE